MHKPAHQLETGVHGQEDESCFRFSGFIQLGKMRSRPKRRLEFPLRPSIVFRSQESLYVYRLILASVSEVFLRPKGGPDRWIPHSEQKSLLERV